MKRLITAYGHFGRDEFVWEQTAKAESLAKELEIAV